MIRNGDIITLNDKDFEEILDKECRKVLGISAKEFLQKRDNGGLLESTAIHDIEMLLRLAQS